MEKIIYSAVKLENGKIITGKRHSDCLREAFRMGGLFLRIGSVQGFLTNKNRFVTREEAAKIAHKAGQIVEKKEVLYSEDVW